MNKIIIAICVLCMLCTSCTSLERVNYTIKGTVNGMNEKTVYLCSEEGNRVVIDSTTVSNNAFTFKGSQPKICFASISTSKGMKSTVILENGIINVYFNTSIKATGTPMNNILNTCEEKINYFDNEYISLIKQMIELKDHKNERNIVEKKIKRVLYKRSLVIKECINQNLNNIIGAYLLHTYESVLTYKEVAKILANVSPVMKEHSFIKEVIERQKAIKHSEIGQKFSDLKMKDVNDKEIALSDYVGKGKYLLINFWASWCAACHSEIPYLKAAYEKFKSKGFEIVSISLDNRKEAWEKSIKELGITWPQMSDLKGWECEGAKIYGVMRIPSMFLIDPNGVIIAKNFRHDAIEKKLSEIFR